MIPKSFTVTQSAEPNNKKANKKLTTMDVSVKKKLGTACFHFLYFIPKRGTIPSSIQNKVIPPTKIKLLCNGGMVSK